MSEFDESRRLDDVVSPTDLRAAFARGTGTVLLPLSRLSAVQVAHAMTVHRSQGSTYKRVFVDVKDILANPIRKERQSLLYVGYSRPSEELIINKEKYVA